MSLLSCGGQAANPPSTFTPTGTTAHVVVTTGDGASLLHPQPAVAFGTGGIEAAQVISVDDRTLYQTMDGFGASLTDSSAWVIWYDLNASQRAALMTQLFARTPAGIGLSLLRQPMGASDFAVNGNYSYDDVPAGQSDSQLTRFSVSHDTTYIIPLLQQAIAINPAVHVVALPWSPPAWMKASGTMNGGNMEVTYFSSLAKYFVLFLQAYRQYGIPVYAISVQNEPLNSIDTYPSEYLSADDESAFIGGNLGPALNQAGLGGVKIFAYEYNWNNTIYPETVLGSSASRYVAGTSFHCYGGNVSAQLSVKNTYPGKDIWFTECSGSIGSTFAGDLVWNAENLMIGTTRNWARSVSLWNLALDQNSGPTNGGCESCRGVVTINTTTSPATVTFNVEYYVLGHLAGFVFPGARRVRSNSPASGEIENVAFLNPDGSFVLFALNPAPIAQSFSVSHRNAYFNYSLPAQSVATFTWK